MATGFVDLEIFRNRARAWVDKDDHAREPFAVRICQALKIERLSKCDPDRRAEILSLFDLYERDPKFADEAVKELGRPKGVTKTGGVPIPEPYDKDGVHFIPSNIVNVCGRCETSLPLMAMYPVGESDKAVWNDEGWFALHQRLGNNQQVPPKFKDWSERIDAGRFCSVFLCASCGGKFNEWLARAD